MKGYYTVFLGKDAQYYFNLKAGNHEIILKSEGYKSKQGALKGIASVQNHCTSDGNYVRKFAKNGKPFFLLRARSHEPIGMSQFYSSEQAMEKGIESVKTNGLSKIIEGTDKSLFELLINDVQYDVKPGDYLGSEILALAGFIGPRFCLFLLEGDKRIEIEQNQKVTVKGCLSFKVVQND